MQPSRAQNVDAVAKAWKASGGEIVSTNREPVSIGTNKIVLLRDLNGLMLEILPAQQPPAPKKN